MFQTCNILGTFFYHTLYKLWIVLKQIWNVLNILYNLKFLWPYFGNFLVKTFFLHNLKCFEQKHFQELFCCHFFGTFWIVLKEIWNVVKVKQYKQSELFETFFQNFLKCEYIKLYRVFTNLWLKIRQQMASPTSAHGSSFMAFRFTDPELSVMEWISFVGLQLPRPLTYWASSFHVH